MQVCVFLGLTRYYRWFMPNFSFIASSLNDLTRKATSERVRLTPATERGFQQVKDVLTSSPILWNADGLQPTPALSWGEGSVAASRVCAPKNRQVLLTRKQQWCWKDSTHPTWRSSNFSTTIVVDPHATCGNREKHPYKPLLATDNYYSLSGISRKQLKSFSIVSTASRNATAKTLSLSCFTQKKIAIQSASPHRCRSATSSDRKGFRHDCVPLHKARSIKSCMSVILTSQNAVGYIVNCTFD